MYTEYNSNNSNNNDILYIESRVHDHTLEGFQGGQRKHQTLDHIHPYGFRKTWKKAINRMPNAQSIYNKK